MQSPIRLLGVAAALPLLASSCGLLELNDDDIVLKRYASLEIRDDFSPAVKMTLSVSDPTPATPARPVPLLERLDAEGQAELIDALHSRVAANGPAALFAELAKTGQAAPAATTNRSTIRKQILLAPEKTGAWTSADRIEELDLALTLPVGSGAEFVSWDVAATSYGTLQVGTVKQTDTNTFNASIEPTLSGTVVGAGALGAESVSEREEQRTITERFVEISGILQKESGTIRMEGAVGRDLEGNTAINLQVRVPSTRRKLTRLAGLTTPTGAFGAPDKASYSFYDMTLPAVLTNDIQVTLGGSYVLRSVTRGEGDDTYLEGDDDAVIRMGTLVAKHWPLVSVTDTERLATYHFVQASHSDSWKVIRVATGPKTTEPLWFATRTEARQFQRWLENHYKAEDTTQVKLGSHPSRGGLALDHDGLVPLQLGMLDELHPGEDL